MAIADRAHDGCWTGLDWYCDEIGRDFETLTRSTALEEIYLVEREREVVSARERVTRGMPQALAAGLMLGTPAQIADLVQSRIAAGINHVVVYLRRAAYEPEQVEWFGREVVPLLGG